MNNIILGNDRNGTPIHWPYNHPDLANRHALILGQSGQGKSHCIRHMLTQISGSSMSAVVFDYSDSYSASTWANPLEEILVYRDGLPVNPFRRQLLLLGNECVPEKDSDTADRICDILKDTLSLTPGQRNVLYSACMQGFRQENCINMQSLRQSLEDSDTERAQAVLEKLAPLADKNIFREEDTLFWENILYAPGKITVIQLSGFSPTLQRLITEVTLWSMYFYTRIHGNTSKPFVVVLDECQRLSFTEHSPASAILTEGRKYGWSAWFATQFLQGNFKPAAINRLEQCALKINFRPTDKEARPIAKSLDPRSIEIWERYLTSLRKGQCIVRCPLESGGVLRASNPLIVQIPAG